MRIITSTISTIVLIAVFSFVNSQPLDAANYNYDRLKKVAQKKNSSFRPSSNQKKAEGLFSPLSTDGLTLWLGDGDGFSWSDDANWDSGTPINSDAVGFHSNNSSSEVELVNNDLTNLRLASVLFSGSSGNGYEIVGGPIKLIEGVGNNNTGESVNVISASLKSSAPDLLLVLSQNNATTVFNSPIDIRNDPLYFYSEDNGISYLLDKISGDDKVYVVGDGSGVYTLSSSHIEVPTVVDDGGVLFGNGNLDSLRIGSDGLLAPLGCMDSHNLRIAGLMGITLEGTQACSGYDRVTATGSVNINGAALVFILGEEFSPPNGSKYRILNNDKTDKIEGRFSGLPQGATFSLEGYNFKISYRGGDGNDITLTRI